MMTTKGEGRRVADIECAVCGDATELRVTKKGRLYVTCFSTACGCQVFSRSRACDRRLAERAKEWASAEDATAFGARAPQPATKPPPGDAKPPRRSFWDASIFGEDAA